MAAVFALVLAGRVLQSSGEGRPPREREVEKWVQPWGLVGGERKGTWRESGCLQHGPLQCLIHCRFHPKGEGAFPGDAFGGHA